MKSKYVVIIVGMLLLVCIPSTTASAGWQSPGNHSTFTLQWLAEYTNQIIQIGPNEYLLIDDIIISETDTLTISAGQSLYFTVNMKIEIYGNFFLNGDQSHPVLLSGSSVKSPTPSLIWEYTGNNIFHLTELRVKFITLTFEAEDGEGMEVEADEPPYFTDSYAGFWNAMPDQIVQAVADTATYYEDWSGLTKLGLEIGWWADADGDGLPNWWEDSHGTDRLDPGDAFDDPDNDGWNNLKEFNKGTNPKNPDTDADNIQDNRDYQPKKPNRKFAFLFECSNFIDLNTLGKEFWVLQDDFDSMNFYTYLYTDNDYDDGEFTVQIEDATDGLVSADGYCEWDELKLAVEDFRDFNDNDVIGDTGDVGKPRSEFGKDIVVIYLDSHGKNTIVPVKILAEHIWWMAFCDGVDDYWKGENSIINQFKVFGNSIDIFWISMCDTWGALNDIVWNDDLGAGDRIVIHTSDKVLNGDDVWENWYDEYEIDNDRGFEGAWGRLSGNDKDFHVMSDKFKGSSKKLYLS